MDRVTIINMILFGFFGFYSSYLGYSFKTKEFWIIIAIMVAVQINNRIP